MDVVKVYVDYRIIGLIKEKMGNFLKLVEN